MKPRPTGVPRKRRQPLNRWEDDGGATLTGGPTADTRRPDVDEEDVDEEDVDEEDVDEEDVDEEEADEEEAEDAGDVLQKREEEEDEDPFRA